ncbi:hypothetical protein BV898_17725 [Hypsibius exemplaris]|uniref:Receptor ligand binding region domain-containing protein n=1 Tax=Hypsibius exemplaris TaxID=2072580 RepID=A0A9X6NMS7_HYPEX|nr:hypothetical protein BV898_17725 [Hypsibius exemplaris]
MAERSLPTLDLVTSIFRDATGRDSMVSLNYIGPSVATGLAELRRTYPFLNVTHRYVVFEQDADMKSSYYATCLDQSYYQGVNMAQWYYRERRPEAVSVWINAGCGEYLILNELARAWNVLYVTTAAGDRIARNRALAPTWIPATYPAPADYAEYYHRFLLRHNWTTIAIILDSSGPQFLKNTHLVVSRTLQAYKDLRVTLHKYASAELIKPGAFEGTVGVLLSDLKPSCRIILFFGHSDSLRRFLVYIVQQPFVNPYFGAFEWNVTDVPLEPRDNLTMLNEVVRSAYRSVILILLSGDFTASEKEQIDALLPTWTGFAAKLPHLPTPYGPNPGYLLAMHNAIQMVGQVVVESFNTSNTTSDPGSGILLAQQFFNRTFRLGNGHVSFSIYGTRIHSISVKQFDYRRGAFQTFIQASEDMEGVLQERTAENLRWFDGQLSVPLNEPRCGYRGDAIRCFSKASNMIVTSSAGGIIVLLFGIVMTTVIIKSIHRHKKANSNWWTLDPHHLCLQKGQSTSWVISILQIL